MEFNWINFFNVLIVVLMLIPNIIFAIRNMDRKPVQVNKALSIIEQIGRYACIVLMIFPLLKKEFGFNPLELMFLYLVCNVLLLLLYLIFWGLFFKSETKSNAIALAIIPTAIFFVTGVSVKHWALMIAAVIFGIAHTLVTFKTYEVK